MAEYKQRIVDAELGALLEFAGAVLIEGARGCGKSATGERHSASTLRLDTDVTAAQITDIDPARLLAGPMPRFIDEWQLAPRLWNHVRRAIDDSPEARFLLAGSAMPADDVTRHSGAGRILRLRMRPMSLQESGHSSGDVSMQALFKGLSAVDGATTLTLDDLVDRAVIGGWPGLQGRSSRQSSAMLKSYVDDVARVDLGRLDGVSNRDPVTTARLLRALGRTVATEARLTSLAADAGLEDRPLAHETITGYLAALERVFVIEDQPSWAPHLRSRARVRKAAKRHLVDPSLAVAALGAAPDRLLDDLAYFGQVVESLAVRDLRVYAQPLGGTVYHYRDDAGREVDAIVELRDGNWIACEVKLADSRADEAAASLHRFVVNLSERTRAPSALVVLTAGTYAYTRPDGVHVVPLGALGA